MLHYGRFMRGFLLITGRVMAPGKTDMDNSIGKYEKHNME